MKKIIYEVSRTIQVDEHIEPTQLVNHALYGVPQTLAYALLHSSKTTKKKAIEIIKSRNNVDWYNKNMALLKIVSSL